MEQINNQENLTPQENRDLEALKSIVDRYDPNFRSEIIEELARMSPEKFDATLLTEKISTLYENTPDMYGEVAQVVHQMSGEELARLKMNQNEKEELESQIENQIETKRRQLIEVVVSGMVQAGAIKEEAVEKWKESALSDKDRFSLPVLQNDLRKLCKVVPNLCGPGTVWDNDLAA